MARQRALKKREDYRGGGYVARSRKATGGPKSTNVKGPRQAGDPGTYNIPQHILDAAYNVQQDPNYNVIGGENYQATGGFSSSGGSQNQETENTNPVGDTRYTTGNDGSAMADAAADSAAMADAAAAMANADTPDDTPDDEEEEEIVDKEISDIPGTSPQNDPNKPPIESGTGKTTTSVTMPGEKPKKVTIAGGANVPGVDVAVIHDEGTFSGKEDVQQIAEQEKVALPTGVQAGDITAAQGEVTTAASQDDITAAKYDAAQAGELADTQAAQGEVTRVGEAAEAELTTTQAATRDAQAEEAAQAQAVAFSENMRSQINPVTGQQEQVASTPDAEAQQREAITGTPATEGQAAEIIGTVGYEASLQR